MENDFSNVMTVKELRQFLKDNPTSEIELSVFEMFNESKEKNIIINKCNDLTVESNSINFGFSNEF